ISSVTRFPVQHCRCKTAGQVSDDWVTGGATTSRKSKRLHRVAQMMIAALGEALEQAPDFEPELSVVATTSGGMTFGEQYYRGLIGRPTFNRCAASLIANYAPQKAVIDAQEAFHLSAPCQVIANACASGTNAVGHAFACIKS